MKNNIFELNMEQLTNNSIKNIKKIKKLNLKSLNLHIEKNKYFIELKNNLIKYYDYYNHLLKNQELNLIKNKNNLSDNSYFIGETTRNKILKLKHKYKINIYNIEFIYITNKTEKIIKNKIKSILIIILTLKKLFHREKSFQSIIIYDINEKKKFPNKKNIEIGPSNCNSGYCNVIYNDKINGSIVLYRNEELIKVLIHESIHANFIDYNIIINQGKSNMDSKICTNYNILLNEAFTETFACLINIILIHNTTKINIQTIFKNEVKYMLNIFNNMMNYYNIEKIDDIIINKGCKKYFKQTTNVFSYYILKTLNYLNIIEFLKLMENNTNNYYKINNNTYNILFVKYVFKNIYLLDNFIKKNKYYDKNLRLSLYELKL